MPSPARRLAPVALVIALLGVGACTGDGDDTGEELPAAGGGAATAGDPADAPDLVRAGVLTGVLGERRRADAVASAGEVVSTWLAALDQPAGDPDRFVGFTRRARALAQRDPVLRALTTPSGPAELQIDLLGREAHAVGATVRVEVPLERGRLRGSLYLTPHEDGWRVFGFDLTRPADRRAGEAR